MLEKKKKKIQVNQEFNCLNPAGFLSVQHRRGAEDSLIMSLLSALACLNEGAPRKMNEIHFVKVRGNWFPRHCFCVLLDVNGEYIV